MKITAWIEKIVVQAVKSGNREGTEVDKMLDLLSAQSGRKRQLSANAPKIYTKHHASAAQTNAAQTNIAQMPSAGHQETVTWLPDACRGRFT